MVEFTGQSNTIVSTCLTKSHTFWISIVSMYVFCHIQGCYLMFVVLTNVPPLSEAEYAFALQKTIIPLLMERNYKPDGWLGILRGSKLFFDFSGKYPYEKKLEELVKELGQRGRKDVSEVTCLALSLSPFLPPPPLLSPLLPASCVFSLSTRLLIFMCICVCGGACVRVCMHMCVCVCVFTQSVVVVFIFVAHVDVTVWVFSSLPQPMVVTYCNTGGWLGCFSYPGGRSHRGREGGPCCQRTTPGCWLLVPEECAQLAPQKPSRRVRTQYEIPWRPWCKAFPSIRKKGSLKRTDLGKGFVYSRNC